MNDVGLKALVHIGIGMVIGIIAFLIAYIYQKIKDDWARRRSYNKTERNKRGVRVYINDKRNIHGKK